MNNSDAILQAIHQLEHNFQEQFHQLDYKLGKGLGDLEKGLKEQRQLIMALQRDSGGIVERQLQDAISRQFGGRYSKQLLARSIVDFSHLFPEEMFDRRANKAAGALAFIRPATQALVQGREIEHLLVRFSKLLVRSGLAPEATWVVDEAEAIIDTTALGKFIGTLDNKSLSKPLSRMQKYLKADKEDRVQWMENCDGPGILALVSAARSMDGQSYFNASDSIQELDDVISRGMMPPDELEIDCRGKLDVTKRKFAYVDIGEIKSKHKLGIGIVQLGIRLSVVAWLLGKCCQVADPDVRRVGRIFIPRGKNDSPSSSAQPAALKKWRYSMYVHYL